MTTGFSMGRIVPEWSAVAVDPQHGGFVWRPIHGARARVYGADTIDDGIVRIDCAVVSIGSGRFVVAGGCDDHPQRARGFFASAFVYDALTHAVEPLPPMPCRGAAAAARIDGKVFAVGGEYAAHQRPCKRRRGAHEQLRRAGAAAAHVAAALRWAS